MSACAAGQYPENSCTVGAEYFTPRVSSVCVSTLMAVRKVDKGIPGAMIGPMLKEAWEPKARSVAPRSMIEGAQAW